MASYFLKEAPKVEILHAAITMDVVTGSALAQANEAQSIRIRSGVFHSSKQIIEVSESDLCKLGKIVWHDPLERTMRRIAHCSFPTFAGTPSAGWNGVRPAPHQSGVIVASNSHAKDAFPLRLLAVACIEISLCCE